MVCPNSEGRTEMLGVGRYFCTSGFGVSFIWTKRDRIKEERLGRDQKRLYYTKTIRIYCALGTAPLTKVNIDVKNLMAFYQTMRTTIWHSRIRYLLFPHGEFMFFNTSLKRSIMMFFSVDLPFLEHIGRNTSCLLICGISHHYHFLMFIVSITLWWRAKVRQRQVRIL